MSEANKGYDQDVLNEFEKLKNRFEGPVEEPEDLSRTMVVPRVEDLIEERPLPKAAANDDFLFAAEHSDAPKFENYEYELVFDEKEEPKKEEELIVSRAARKKAGEDAPAKEAKIKLPKIEMKKKQPKKEKAEKPEKPEKTKDGKRKINWKRIILILLALCLIGGIAVAAYVISIVSKAPKIEPDNFYELLSENSIIYDRDGNVLDNIYSGDALRTNLEYNEMPKQLIDAFVSIEDKTFWDHHGFNFVRIVGAVWQKVSGQSERIGGTSTITQQLARNLYLAEIKDKRDMTRKVTEAYYTIQIERKLSKEQIIEAYLNTIYLGYNCNGVAAASQAYFSKEVGDLTLLECCQLAALPQSPVTYAPLKRAAVSDVKDIESLDIITKDDDWVVYYNNAAENRIKLVLRFMHEQEKIDDATYETAKADSIRNYLNPGTSAVSNVTTSYFADYVKSQVLKDLIAAGYDSDTASDLLYNGGLRINSTMSMRVQEIMDKEYDDPANFPGVVIQRKDSQGNALDANGKVLLYNMTNYFDADGNFVLKADEFEEQSNGNLLLFSGKRMNFYKTSVGGNIDYSAEFKNIYEFVDQVCYSRAGGVLSIPAEYKDRDANGNLIISKAYFDAKPEAFTKNEDGTITISKDYFTLKQRVRQPQSAMVIMDYENGHILGMVGGRDLEGKLLYNRATSTRQPGSSIKPLAVYSVALQKGASGYAGYTAAMPIDDSPIMYDNQIWPKNWYDGYKGMTNLRHAVEQSINACSVNLFLKMADPSSSIAQLRKMGITSIVDESESEINDANASALALGGMTKGISPLEMTAAYGTFGNYGVYTEPICYTTVTTKNGDIIISKEASHMEVMDESVASLMTDILRTVVTNGLGSPAKLKSQPSAGKTGTTSERYDIWFCGLTPQYSAACWIGSDVNIPVNSDSSKAAKLWAKIMDQVCAELPREEFEMRGEFVTETVDKYSGTYSPYTTEETALTEIFIKGTEPSAIHSDENVGLTYCTVCADSGYLATPMCPAEEKLCVIRPGGVSWEKQVAQFEAQIASIEGADPLKVTVDSMPDSYMDAPDYYCPYHNPDPSAYPISPFAELSPTPGYNDYEDEDGDELWDLW